MKNRLEIPTVAQLVVLLTALNALPAVAVEPTPRLILGITVDQLRSDYLYLLQSRFGEGGFKRLMRDGVVYDNVTFELDNPDATAAIASLATGSYPFQNGISGQFIFDQQTLRKHSIFFDNKYIGNATDGYWSPRALVSSTMSDELKLASQHASRIYSIAPNAEEAIIAAGHTADGAFWIDDKSGVWCSTTYYREFPNFVANQNNTLPFFADPIGKGWEPQNSARNNVCTLAPYNAAVNGHFSHRFQQSRQTIYPWVKTTPYVNDAVAQMAQLFVSNQRVADKPGSTDMLQLTFYAGTYQHAAPEVYPCELEETYLRLDQTLEQLLRYIDQRIGLTNTFIYLIGTGDTNPNNSEVPGLSMGEFNVNRCTALLNIQLISLYGQGQWVDGCEGLHIYLNRRLIEQKQLQLDEVTREAAKLVSLFSGIDEVFTAQQLLHQDYSQRISRIRNSYRKETGGDLVLQLQPGWRLRPDDKSQPQPQVRHDIYPGPAIFYAPQSIAPQRITTPVEAIHIAPTVAKAIRIRAPSACRALPLF